MKALALTALVLASGCMIEIHPGRMPPSHYSTCTTMEPGFNGSFHDRGRTNHLNYYGPESNRRDGPLDDILFLGMYSTDWGYTEREYLVGEGSVIYNYSHKFTVRGILNDNDGIAENNVLILEIERL